MKKKIIVSVICITLILSAALVAFAACNKIGTTKVSSYSELLTASGNVVLTADIDCDYEPISSFDFASFDGQGFKIKNFVLKVSGATDKAAFFGPKTESVRNVTFDGVKIEGDQVLALSVVKIGGGGVIENVTVKNAEISAVQSPYFPCYVGAIYAGAYDAQLNRSNTYTTSYNAEIINCKVENVTIEIEGHDSFSNSGVSNPRLYAGMLAGACNYVSDSYAKKCTITASSNSDRSYPIVGGLVGYCEGTVVNSYSKGNELNAYSNRGSIYAKGTGYATVTVGGLVGLASSANTSVTGGSKKIQYCFSDGNEITAACNSNVYAGGLVGKLADTQVGQCYAVENTIEAKCSNYSFDSDVVRGVCGLVGYASNSVIVSSFACDNTVTENANRGYSNKFAACGFAVVDDSTSVSYCGTSGNTLEGAVTDEFSHLPIANLYSCVVTSTTLGNANSCKKITDSVWHSESSIKKELKIGGPYWQFPSTAYPTLVF